MELSKKILILIYGRAFSFLISLVIPIALTRLLLKEDYGTYQQLIMLYSIIQSILLLGIPQSLLYYYPRREKDKHPLLVKQTWSIVVCSSVFIISASLSSRYFRFLSFGSFNSVTTLFVSSFIFAH